MLCLQTVPSYDNLPAGLPQRAGHRLRERNRPALAPAEDHDDDRRVHRRQRGRKGTHEDVEPTRDEIQLRGRLPDTPRLPDVPANERQGVAREKLVQEFHPARELATRLRATQPRRFAPDRADVEPNVS